MPNCPISNCTNVIRLWFTLNFVPPLPMGLEGPYHSFHRVLLDVEGLENTVNQKIEHPDFFRGWAGLVRLNRILGVGDGIECAAQHVPVRHIAEKRAQSPGMLDER